MLNKKELKSVCTPLQLLLFDCDGVLTDGRIILGTGKNDTKNFSTKDGMGIALWRRAGFLSGCITGRTSQALARRAGELKLDELHQGVGRKQDVLEDLLRRRKLKAGQVAYIGDDLNDLPLLSRVGFFLAPADAHPEVLTRAHWVLKNRGGKGAIREAVDMILAQKNLLKSIVSSFLT